MFTKLAHLGTLGLGLGVGVNVGSGDTEAGPTQTPPLHGTRNSPERWLSSGVVRIGLVRASLFFLLQSGEVLVTVKEHSRQINDIQLSRDMTMFVTASKDNTAKVSPGKGSGGADPTLQPGSRFPLKKAPFTDFSPAFSL